MDIDLAGIFAAFVGLALGALAVVWAIVASIVVRVRSANDAGARARRALVGPAICALAGALFFFVGAYGGYATGRVFDEAALFAAPGVPLVAIATTLYVTSRRRAVAPPR